VWRRKGKEGRTEENYWTDKGRKKIREGKEPYEKGKGRTEI
jgi:hypothetical protein